MAPQHTRTQTTLMSLHTHAWSRTLSHTHLTALPFVAPSWRLNTHAHRPHAWACTRMHDHAHRVTHTPVTHAHWVTHTRHTHTCHTHTCHTHTPVTHTPVTHTPVTHLSVLAPLQFSHAVVLSQLRYTGMLETVRIRKAGFPTRHTLAGFSDRCVCTVLDTRMLTVLLSEANSFPNFVCSLYAVTVVVICN